VHCAGRGVIAGHNTGDTHGMVVPGPPEYGDFSAIGCVSEVVTAGQCAQGVAQLREAWCGGAGVSGGRPGGGGMLAVSAPAG
jgi:hypothetical protein